MAAARISCSSKTDNQDDKPASGEGPAVPGTSSAAPHTSQDSGLSTINPLSASTGNAYSLKGALRPAGPEYTPSTSRQPPYAQQTERRTAGSASSSKQTVRPSGRVSGAGVNASRASGSGKSSGTYESESDYSSLTNTRRMFSEDSCLSFLDRLQPPKWYAKMRPRHRQWFYCLMAEVVIILALVAQFCFFRFSLRRLNLEQVANQIQLMDMTWGRKLDQAALLARGWSQTSEMVSFLKGTGTSAAAIRKLVIYDSSTLAVEYAVVVNASAAILVDVNTNRTGTFDPHGVVSKVMASPQKGQLVTSALITWPELQSSDAPVIRETYSSLLDSDLTHPFDTGAVSLIRYIVTPVFQFTNGTGDVLGAIVVGDIVNGKTTISYLCTNAFKSGFAGVYTEVGNGGYIRASSSAAVDASAVGVVGRVELSQADPITPRLQQELLKKAACRPGTVVSVITRNMVLAAKTAPYGKWGGSAVPTDTPPAIFVRGLYFVDDHTWISVISRTWWFLATLVLINLLSVKLSTRSFIEPLEDLASALKKKKQVDLKSLGSLKLYAKYLVRLWLTLIVAGVCSGIIAQEIKRGMRTAVGNLALSESGIGAVSYNIIPDQMAQACRSDANLETVRKFVTFPNDTALINQTMALLQRERKNRQLEFVAIIGSNEIALVGASRTARGRYYNPSGVVSLTVRNNLNYKLSMVLDFATYNVIRPPMMQRHIIPGVPDSKLNPYNTGRDALVRWTTSPIYTYTNLARKMPDAVFITGDNVNGKTGVVERMLMVTKTGYCGYFTPDTHGGYGVVSSVLRDFDTKMWYSDLDISSHDVVRACHANGGAPTLAWGEINGKPYALVAVRVPKDRYLSEYGSIDMNGAPPAYLVYGKPGATTRTIEHQQSVWIVVGAVLQISMMLMMNYMAYKPFRKLMRILEDKGFADPKQHPTVRKVIQVYVIQYTRDCIADLRSRPLPESIHMYMIVPLSKAIRRAWKRLTGRRRRRKTIKTTSASGNTSTHERDVRLTSASSAPLNSPPE